MAPQDKPTSAPEGVWRPSTRGFLVYYVAFAIAVFGPLINPAVGVPPWAGFVVGLMVAAAVALQKFGQEYRATPKGVKRVGSWPAVEVELSWPEIGDIQMQRGLTQTLLNCGNLVFLDKTGTPRLSWDRLADPKGVKAALEARQATYLKGVGEEGGGD